MRVALIALFALAGIVPAQAAELKLLTTGAFKPIAQELVPVFERATGHRVTIENDTAGALGRRIAEGEKFDVVVLTPSALAPLYDKRVLEDSATALARVGIGVAVKEGAHKPDISTLDAFRRSLIAARSIAYIDPASGGTSGIYLAKLFEQLHIADQLKPKSVLVKGGLVAEKVVSGEAEIGMQQASEILAVRGALLVGPLPAEVQLYTLYVGATSQAVRDRTAATALLAALVAPDTVLRRHGMEAPEL
jgi:molybdate transport system substrate-binding protein